MLLRWWADLSTRDRVAYSLVGVLLLLASAGWIAGIVTGDPGAYMKTELSWRRSWIGDDGGVVPTAARRAFEAEYERLYGHIQPGGAIIAVAGAVALALTK